MTRHASTARWRCWLALVALLGFWLQATVAATPPPARDGIAAAICGHAPPARSQPSGAVPVAHCPFCAIHVAAAPPPVAPAVAGPGFIAAIRFAADAPASADGARIALYRSRAPPRFG